MLRTDRQTDVMQQRNSTSGVATGTGAWAAGIASSCPEDCHYCSGPETD
jgi:hypothetical protein